MDGVDIVVVNFTGSRVTVSVIGSMAQTVGVATALNITRCAMTLIERAFQFHVGDCVTAPVALDDWKT